MSCLVARVVLSLVFACSDLFVFEIFAAMFGGRRQSPSLVTTTVVQYQCNVSMQCFLCFVCAHGIDCVCSGAARFAAWALYLRGYRC